MELDRTACLDALDLGDRDLPALLLVTSSWAMHGPAPQPAPPAALGPTRALGLPGFRLGRPGDVPVLHCDVYGAPRAVEPVHVAGEIGVPVVALVGSCAALQSGLDVGAVVVAQTATIGEGASQYYGGHGTATGDPGLADAAAAALADRGVRAQRGRVVTTGALVGQQARLIESWSGAGHLALDLETSAVLTVAAYFGMRALALLVVRHAPRGAHDWLATLQPADGALDVTAELLAEVAVGVART